MKKRRVWYAGAVIFVLISAILIADEIHFNRMLTLAESHCEKYGGARAPDPNWSSTRLVFINNAGLVDPRACSGDCLLDAKKEEIVSGSSVAGCRDNNCYTGLVNGDFKYYLNLDYPEFFSLDREGENLDSSQLIPFLFMLPGSDESVGCQSRELNPKGDFIQMESRKIRQVVCRQPAENFAHNTEVFWGNDPELFDIPKMSERVGYATGVSIRDFDSGKLKRSSVEVRLQDSFLWSFKTDFLAWLFPGAGVEGQITGGCTAKNGSFVDVSSRYQWQSFQQYFELGYEMRGNQSNE